jgi:uncharacterized protein YbjT (DUF2867 family)
VKRFLVSGATGRIGKRLAVHLASQAGGLRLLVRDRSRMPVLPFSECVQGDFDDMNSMAAAFDGVQAAFLYTPAHPDPRLIQLAVKQGVQHVVLLSSASVVKVSAADNPVARRHRLAEEAVLEGGIAWTFLRPDMLASNCLSWAPSIRTERCVYVPFPESQRNPIHEDDVALVAAHAMVSGHLMGRALSLTGPSCLTIAQQVELIGQSTGTTLRCVQIDTEQAVHAMSSGPSAVPMEVARRLVEYMRKTTTTAPEISPDFELAMGRAPRPFADWVADHIVDFCPYPN